MALTTFREIQRRVGQRISNLDTGTTKPNAILPKIKVWINERYQRIYDSKPWPGTYDSTTLQIVASQKQYALGTTIPADGIIAVFDQTNGLPIRTRSIDDHIRYRASSLDVTGNVQTGDPTRYAPIGTYTVQDTTGSSAETITVVSSDSADASPLVVHVMGKVSGVLVSEDIVLTGTSSVASSNTYDANQKLQVSIGTNDGTTPSLTGYVTVTGTTSSNTIAVISPQEIASEYAWIEVSPTPDADATQPVWLIWHRLRFRELVSDNDIPVIDIVPAIIQGAYSDALREDGQEQEAEIADQKFIGMVEEAWASIENPFEISQFIPESQETLINGDFGRTITVY